MTILTKKQLSFYLSIFLTRDHLVHKTLNNSHTKPFVKRKKISKSFYKEWEYISFLQVSLSI